MIWRVEVTEKEGFLDAVSIGIKRDVEDLGFKNRIKDVKTVHVYLIDGDLTEKQITRICEHLLIDRVTQTYSCSGPVYGAGENEYQTVEVSFNPGVMDPVEDSVKKGIRDLGLPAVRNVRTGRKYLFKGKLSRREIIAISEKLLFNKLIQHRVKKPSSEIIEPPAYIFSLEHINILAASGRQLKKISKDRHIFLSLEEMRTIQKYFRRLRRNPTDCELETIAQTWSEHCSHKTLRGRVLYNGKVIKNLLKSTIMKVTDDLGKKWCVSVFKDNAGIIRFDKDHNVCFKVETHNHPSALEPYGGAGTGIGGVIRDPLGTGLGAKPIINTDVFCFASPDYPHRKLPKGVLHPKRVLKGVVGGVRDYGNKMGIPTANGAVLFDDNYLGNPLVFCGNVGLMPKNKSFKKVNTGDLIILVGGRTGRDGIHGATFSSGELTAESEDISAPCVQIGNPITEKKMTDAILEARDKDLYNAITDCGAGGLSSAVGEMGEETGAEVYLESVPLKYRGVSYSEIWISEAQERMVLACRPNVLDDLKRVFEKENVELSVIGSFTGTKRLRLIYNGTTVADLDMKFLHGGLPKVVRTASWKAPEFKEPSITFKSDLTDELYKLLGNYNIASKEWIIRQYDHEVQGGSVLKPLQGVENDGPGDACVFRPILSSYKGVVLSCGINPDFGKIDPYWMAASVIDEALRQIVCVGADINKAAILDNFCWGNTDKPDRLGGVVRAALACYDIAKAYGVPFISGKDSLNNEFSIGKRTISIPPTLLISCISIMDDVRKAISMDAKEPGSPVYVIGKTFHELGGSQYYKNKGSIGKNVPKVDPKTGRTTMTALSGAIAKGYVKSCHDCSDGGIAVACAEMAFAGGLGMEVRADRIPTGDTISRDDSLLFSESNTRFIVEVNKKFRSKFEAAMNGVPSGMIGTTTGGKAFVVRGSSGAVIIRAHIRALKDAWKSPLGNI
ncbi:MAG: phosphoribosylformylglycinamidine synthase subunit PurL [Candidatus Omnitrophota bacterium]